MPDFANSIRGTPVVIYDFVGKLGDWLFKQPVILSLRKSGYEVAGSPSNPFPCLNGPSGMSVSENRATLAFIFTGSRDLSLNKRIFKKHEDIIEFRRLGRFSEAILCWHRGRVRFVKKFQKIYEQERVEAMIRFMGFQFEERQIVVTRLQNKLMALNFNVGEIEAERLNFRIEEVFNVIDHAIENSYTCILIRKKGKPETILEEKIIKTYKHKIQIEETEGIKEACNVIDRCTYYFGADSGLGHYAVQGGKVVFSLYNSGYHGLHPLFNSTYCNHLIFFGNHLFSKGIISYLRVLEGKTFLRRARSSIKSFLGGKTKIISLGLRSNQEKFSRLIIRLAMRECAVEKIMESAKSFFSGIFFSDRIYDVDYGKTRVNTAKVFINSQQFVSKIEKLLNEELGIRKKNVNIFAKNSSFFYGTALKRSVSDIDLMTVVAPRLSRVQKEELLQKMNALLKGHGFSVALPHQVPIAVQKLARQNQYRCIIKNGCSSFLRSIPTDRENIEKYKSRVKLLIILGEVSEEELRVLLHQLEKDRYFGRSFLQEINALRKERRKFLKYRIFIKKIENILAGIGGFGSRGGILLRFSVKEQCAWKGVVQDLMAHGIIYVAGNRLYINWDIRRPQHAWFIPIALQWEARDLGGLVAKALKSQIYKSDSFKTLKELKFGSISIQKAANLLKSQSYLVVAEVFRYLQQRMSFLNEEQLITHKEIREYLRLENSNCNTKADKKIDLLGLVTGKPLPLSGTQVARLSKYNLFVHYLNTQGHFDINLTSFFKIKNVEAYHSAGEFQKDFRNSFLKLLREYYLYKINGLERFFLTEKRKEILFNYFVKGRNLMEGPRNQQKKISVFLKKINLPSLSLFADGKYLEALIVRYRNNRSSENGNFIISWAISRALAKRIP